MTKPFKIAGTALLTCGLLVGGGAMAAQATGNDTPDPSATQMCGPTPTTSPTWDPGWPPTDPPTDRPTPPDTPDWPPTWPPTEPPTATPTPTQPPTGTPTQTPTEPPTGTPTSTPTGTPTPTQPPTGTPTQTPTNTPTQTPTSTPTASDQIREVLRLTNEERTKAGLSALTLDSCLTEKVAQPWAEQMAQEDRLYHQDMGQAARKCPGNNGVGENIAMGYGSPREAVEGWMNSQGHRENILNSSYKVFGGGLAKAANGSLYWVQNFGM